MAGRVLVVGNYYFYVYKDIKQTSILILAQFCSAFEC